MRRRKLFFIISGLLLVSAAGAVAVGFSKPVRVTALHQEENIPVAIYGLGTLEAHTVSRIGFEISGTLAELNADHGDYVRKGEVLARLDSAQQESRVLKARASLEKAKATLLVAQANEQRARSDLKLKEQVDRRRQPLVKTGSISLEEADEKRTAVELARAELTQAEGEVATAQAAIKDAAAQVEIEKVLLSRHALPAPFDARVVTRHKELGSVQFANEPLFTIVDPSTFWARVHVDEELAGNLRVGQTAEVRLRSVPGRAFPGRVQRIDIESDRVSEERRIYVAFDSPPDPYHLGEQAEAFITVTTLDKAWLIPGTAIREQDGSSGLIWTVADGRLDPCRVTLGPRLLDGRYAVTGGLTPGTLPVTGVPSNTSKGTKAILVEGARP